MMIHCGNDDTLWPPLTEGERPKGKEEEDIIKF